MIGTWASAPQNLQIFKGEVIQATGLGKDALHIYTGLAVFLAIRLLWRWRGGWSLAWLAALVLATAVEWLDMRAIAGDAPIKPDAAHWHDIWNTMFWPTVLLITGRWLHPAGKPAIDIKSGDLTDQTLEQPPPI